MKTSNFAFLAEKWPIQASLGQLAGEYLLKDPNTAMVKIRQFGETF